MMPFTTAPLQTIHQSAETLKVSGRLAEAADLYKSCLKKRPEDLDLLYEYGEVLFDLERLEEAADCFRLALSLEPHDAACTIMLAKSLHRLKKPQEALHFYRRAQRLAPHLSVVHLMAGITAIESELRDEARTSFARALEMEPDNISARLYLCMMHLTMFSSTEELDKGRSDYADALDDLIRNTRLDTPVAIEAAVAAVGLMSTFFLPYQGQNDRELQKKYGRWICKVMGEQYPQHTQVPTRHWKEGEKLRIGFVSAHFRNHSVWKIPAKGWLQHLDRQTFMVHSYYAGGTSDSSTEEARRLSDVFVMESDVAVLAEAISRHKPHVLIYLGLGMDSLTLRLAGLRLAPVQCVSWGHPVTSGMPTMDYFLSSNLMEPPDGDDHYSEELVRLPNLSACYPLPPLDNVPIVTIPGVSKGDVSFLCCQNLMKYLPKYDNVFPAIAAQVPKAKFVFIRFSEPHCCSLTKRLDAAFARYGLLADDHVVFVPPLNSTGFAALNAATDIFLDSIGWSGCNTAFESLPFNKPIVTLPGELMRGRHAAAMLRMMGVEETIAANEQNYVEIAVRLANDKSWYNIVASRMSENKHRAYGDQECVRALESFLKSACFKMSQNSSRGQHVQ
ncbi:MAG: O-linked N-acetylglucosamine transferase, SPINDLY family protein [Desulfuromonadaceae bacterium]